VLYFFTADWCPICEALDRTVFSDPKVAALIQESFVPVEVSDRRDSTGDSSQDVDALRFRFLVSRLPTLVVSMPDSGPAVSQEGAPVYSKMLRFLETASSRLAEMTREWESRRPAPSS
jgi:thiol:disulfide interchange protein